MEEGLYVVEDWATRGNTSTLSVATHYDVALYIERPFGRDWR